MRCSRLAAALLAGALGLLSGCGGSDSLSDKQLRARATVLCATAARRAGRIPTPTSADHSIAFLKLGIAALRSELAGLRTLKPTSDDVAGVYSTSLAALTQQLAALENTVHKLRSGQDPVVAWRALQQRLGPLESEADAGWRALGLKACLSG